MTIQIPGLSSLILLRKQGPSFAAVSLLMAALFSVTAYAVDRFDSAHQLLQLTSFDSILRTDTEQAGFITDRLPEDLPQELRSDLRRVMDSNLDYNKMEEALIRFGWQGVLTSRVRICGIGPGGSETVNPKPASIECSVPL